MATEADYAFIARDVISRQASVSPRRIALNELSTGRSLTYQQLESEVRRCHGLLRSALPGRGAGVALLARNSIHHVTLFYGCARAGAVFQPLNWRLSAAELEVLAGEGRPEILIYEAEFEAAAQGALAAGSAHRIFRIGGAYGDEFAAALAAQAPAAPEPIDPFAPSMLLFTSGTTGKPKGVIVTPKTTFYSGVNFTFVAELFPGHAQLCDVPLFHVVGLLAVMHGALMVGGTIHLSDRFDPAASLSRLTDPTLGVTHYFIVPQMAKAMIDQEGFAAADLKGLRLFTGGAPMPEALTFRLIDAGILPCNGYGMSENGTILGVPADTQIARAKIGSAGVPSPAVEVRLVGSDGVDVADGQVGEIWLRGPSVTPGYWNNPEATAAAFTGGWFRTGDAARRDEDGFYFIVDRWKDMYISGGENVYPAEVENVLTAMESIAEAAVIGIPDDRWGEAGCAFLVSRSGAACDAAEVKAWCSERLARYKLPAHIRFVDALPRTASGKVRKDELRRVFTPQPQSEMQS